MDNNTSVPEVVSTIEQNPQTITVNVPDEPQNRICLECTPEPNKFINTNEQGQCLTCGRVVTIQSDNLQAPQLPTESVAPSDTIHTGENTKAVEGEVVEHKSNAGRPSKYNERMLQAAINYYELCSGKKDGKKRMPFIEELAIECDVDGDTIVQWAKDVDNKAEFSATYKKIMNLQKLRNIQQGYSAKNPTFSIFMLKANHGMIETEKRILSGERDSEPLQLSVTNYKDAGKSQIEAGAAQVVEEGSE